MAYDPGRTACNSLACIFKCTACLESAKRHAERCVALQVPVGGEEVAAEVAVVGSPQEFDFEIRSVFATLASSSQILYSLCK